MAFIKIMSRTRITKMDNKNIANINLSSLLGLNAYSIDDTGDCFQNHVNKSLGNGKQCINSDITSISDVNNSLLNTLNIIDSTLQSDTSDIPSRDENTYTLDDLLDLESEALNTNVFFDVSLEEENLFLSPNMSNEAMVETVIGSPLSSSSEESCDLDEILFMDTPTLPTENTNSLPSEEVMQQDDMVTIDKSLLGNLLASNGDCLEALSSILLQYQNIATQEENVQEVECSPFAEPSSPATSESETESIRYTPYKKRRTPEQKQRKKAQNRTAATRYRIKKKDELKAMSEEADQLEKKNKDLKGKVDGLKSEIDYLKNLMLDVIKARLVKGASPENILSVVMAQ